jgi:PIN domain nuclease of toxin-antitoxin system
MLTFTVPFDQFMLEETVTNGIDILAIAVVHATAVAFLPMHHRDPFDRLMIAQAIAEKMVLVSSDEAIDRYGAAKIW